MTRDAKDGSRPVRRKATPPAVFGPALVLTVLLELVTCVLRFGWDLQSTQRTASIGRMTLGIRIHHSYPGMLAILVACWLWNRFPRASRWILVVGLALVLSDLVHHFIVLWIVTGDPQFDLVYP